MAFTVIGCTTTAYVKEDRTHDDEVGSWPFPMGQMRTRVRSRARRYSLALSGQARGGAGMSTPPNLPHQETKPAGVLGYVPFRTVWYDTCDIFPSVNDAPGSVLFGGRNEGLAWRMWIAPSHSKTSCVSQEAFRLRFRGMSSVYSRGEKQY
jgi:hypothetical protein